MRPGWNGKRFSWLGRLFVSLSAKTSGAQPRTIEREFTASIHTSWYVGLSVRTQSPGSRKTLALRSSACCEPLVMRMFSGEQNTFRFRISAEDAIAVVPRTWFALSPITRSSFSAERAWTASELRTVSARRLVYPWRYGSSPTRSGRVFKSCCRPYRKSGLAFGSLF